MNLNAPRAAEPADRPVQSPLTAAISLWRAGRQIPMTVYAALAEDGYDVPSLERFYRSQKLPK